MKHTHEIPFKSIKPFNLFRFNNKLYQKVSDTRGQLVYGGQSFEFNVNVLVEPRRFPKEVTSTQAAVRR